MSNNKKRQIRTLVEQAAGALAAQRLDICEQLCAKLEEMQPGNADVANIRGVISVQAGDAARAEELFVQAINASPRRPEFHENLGKLYLSQMLYNEAAERYRSALQLSPNSPDIKLGYCASLNGIGQADKALPILEQLRSKHPKHSDVLMALFHALYNLKHYDEALACLDDVIKLNPGHDEAHRQKAQVLMQQGKMSQAEEELRVTLEKQPDDIKAWSILAGLKKYTDQDTEALQVMQGLYEKTDPDTPDRVRMCFTLAKVHEDMQQFDEAFAYYAEGNALRHRHSNYNLDAELAHMQAVMDFFTPEVMRRTSGLDDERPVFIVGMPRCGSTLTEQILASHPKVGSRGEWNAFERLLLDLGDSDSPITLEEMTRFSSEQWGDVGRGYLDKLDEGPTAERITDKTLINIRLIGAIHCALPKARIVHVRRHPLDNCLAIFRAHFFEGQFDYGYSLGQLGYYYRMYRQLMQHWREVLPEGVMYELDYEQLVTNQEAETRKLLAHCALEWDDACMKFNRADNVVQTSSIAQVRRGIYSDAVARWRCYEKHLQPLTRILGAD